MQDADQSQVYSHTKKQDEVNPQVPQSAGRKRVSEPVAGFSCTGDTTSRVNCAESELYALGVIQRQGMGRLRHVDCVFFVRTEPERPKGGAVCEGTRECQPSGRRTHDEACVSRRRPIQYSAGPPMFLPRISCDAEFSRTVLYKATVEVEPHKDSRSPWMGCDNKGEGCGERTLTEGRKESDRSF